MKLRVLMLGLALAVAGAAAADCRAYQETIDGIAYLTLENDLILVRVLPAMGGAISDFELKGHGPLLAQGRITREQVIPPVPVYREQRNGRGLTDWFYKGGAYDLSPWEAEIVQLQEAPDIWAVRVRHEMVTREVAIHENEAAVSVRVTVTNTGDEPFGKSYWLHGVYAPGDSADLTGGTQRLIVPIAATTERRRTLAETSDAMLLKEAPQERWSRFLAPAQPWMALVDSARKLLCGTVIGPEDFNEQTLFYSWAGEAGEQPVISQEVIFDARDLAPGDSAEYAAALVACAGLSDVDYLDGHLALDIDLPESTPPGEVHIPARVATWHPERVATLELVLRSAEIVRAASCAVRDVGPVSPWGGVLIAEDVPPGEYELSFRLETEGAPAEGEFRGWRLVVK